MIFKDNYGGAELLNTAEYIHISRDGTACRVSEPVLKEHLLRVYVNARLTMRLVCTPQYMGELVLGRLLTEGIISSVRDVEEIIVSAEGDRVEARISENTINSGGTFVEVTPSSCTANHILDSSYIKNSALECVVPIEWNMSQIFGLADRFHSALPIYGKTYATHSCFLAEGDNILFCCEDIGRHNALDKVIGHALYSGIDLKSCMVYSSGRIPVDMVEKVIRSGIPVFVSKASPSGEAVELAKKYNLTLICAARQDRLKLFSGEIPEN